MPARALRRRVGSGREDPLDREGMGTGVTREEDSAEKYPRLGDTGSVARLIPEGPIVGEGGWEARAGAFGDAERVETAGK